LSTNKSIDIFVDFNAENEKTAQWAVFQSKHFEDKIFTGLYDL
jgi:hypothetical protein